MYGGEEESSQTMRLTGQLHKTKACLLFEMLASNILAQQGYPTVWEHSILLDQHYVISLSLYTLVFGIFMQPFSRFIFSSQKCVNVVRMTQLL